jgi:hypothetical protein
MDLAVVAVVGLAALAALVFLLKSWRLLLKLTLLAVLLLGGGAFLCEQTDLPFCPGRPSPQPPSYPPSPPQQPSPAPPGPGSSAPYGGTPLPQLPDLVITNAVQTPNPAPHGVQPVFRIWVYNDGAPFASNFWVEGPMGSAFVPGGLQRNESKVVDLVVPGWAVSVTFMADSGRVVQESNEANNSFIARVWRR